MESRQGQATIKSLIDRNKDKLDRQELEQLLALSLHKNIEYIYKHPNKKLAPTTVKTFRKLLNKRLANWSLAYLKGYKEFCGFKFIVSKHTLIPRPTSELIIEEALKFIKQDYNVVDIGTGSGCLILSLAKQAKTKANYLATDISGLALKIARSNARKLGLKNSVEFIKSDLLNRAPKRKFNIVLANLPYLTPGQMKEPTIAKEPSSALLSGKDGLEHYKRLLKQLPTYLAKKYLVLLEIDPSQEAKIKKEIVEHLPQAKLKFIKDLDQQIRIVKITN